MGWLPGTRIFTWAVCPLRSRVAGSTLALRLRAGSLNGSSEAREACRPRAARSPGRPPHPAAAQQVKVQMEDALAGVGTDVRQEPPAGPRGPGRLGEVRGRLEDLCQHLTVLVREQRRRAHVVLRYQDEVRGGLRV